MSSFDPFVLKMKVQKTDTVLDVKNAVMKAYGIPIANQQLISGRMILVDDDPLSLYKIKKIVSYGWTRSPHHLRLRCINHLRLRRIHHLRLLCINHLRLRRIHHMRLRCISRLRLRRSHHHPPVLCILLVARRAPPPLQTPTQNQTLLLPVRRQ